MPPGYCRCPMMRWNLRIVFNAECKKRNMLNRKPYLFIPVLFAWLVAACKKSNLTEYVQPDMIYVYKDFYNTNKDSATYSFAIKPNGVMTDTVKVPLRIMGIARDKDRTVAVQTVAGSTTATS